jgi:hypothetical protein
MTGRATLHRMAVLLICTALGTPGCATARWSASAATLPSAPGQQVDPVVMAEYVQKLPPGTTIRVDRVGGKSLRGTLMKATDRSLIVQPKTRIPEPAVEIPLDDVLRVTPEAANGSNIGKAIGIGAAAGAGAALGVILILIAVFSD